MVINGCKKLVFWYIVDFVYECDGKMVIEDVKGVIILEYCIKCYLMVVCGL